MAKSPPPFSHVDVDDLVDQLDRSFPSEPHLVAGRAAPSQPGATPVPAPDSKDVEVQSQRITLRAPPDLEIPDLVEAEARATVRVPASAIWGARRGAPPSAPRGGVDPRRPSMPRTPGPPPLPGNLRSSSSLDAAQDAERQLAQTRPDLRRLGSALLAAETARAHVEARPPHAAAPVVAPLKPVAAPPRPVAAPPRPVAAPPRQAVAPVPGLPTVVITEVESEPEALTVRAPTPLPSPPSMAVPPPSSPVAASASAADRPRPAASAQALSAARSSLAQTQEIRLGAGRPSKALLLSSLAACVLVMGGLIGWGIMYSEADRGTSPAAAVGPSEPARGSAAPPMEGTTAESRPEQGLLNAPVTAAAPAQTTVPAAPPGSAAARGPKSARAAGSERRPPPTRIAMETEPTAPPAAASGHDKPPVLSGRIFGDEEDQ